MGNAADDDEKPILPLCDLITDLFSAMTFKISRNDLLFTLQR
jgi:hypothetical protein